LIVLKFFDRIKVMQNVKQLGSLEHLEFFDGEVQKFQSELDLITAYVRQLHELDLDGVEPTVFGQALSNVFREDVPHTVFSQEEALANAPERIGNEFKVPKIVE